MSDTATSATTLSGRYRLDERIGSGGAGEVWQAYDEVLARVVAIKLLHPALQHDEPTVERFKREAAAAARLTHPNVVVVYDVCHEEDRDYLVMELVDGAPLSTILETERLAPMLAAEIGAQVADALASAHELSLIHRDVKPANIIISREGLAKVADFGIAKAVGDGQARLTATGTIVGSAAYVAPEQLRDHEIDGRTDVYALGLVLHECLTGQRPFAGGTPAEVAARRLREDATAPSELVDGIPPELDEIIIRATRREPAERFTSAATLAAALRALTTPAARDELAGLAQRFAPRDVTGTMVLPRDVRYGDTAQAAGSTRVVDGDAVTAPRRKVDQPTSSPTTDTASGPAEADAAATTVLPAHDDTDAGHDPAATRAPRGGRGARRILLAVGLIAAAAALVALLSGGRSSTPDGGNGTGQPETIAITDAGDHDPYGDREHPEDVPRAYDGDPATVWNTQIYNGSDLGGLKPGVGIWFDLGEAGGTAGEVELVFAEAGSDIAVFSGSSAPQGDPNDWGTLVAEQPGVPSEVTLEIPEDAAGRFYVVWITRLSGDRTQLAEVTFRPR